MIVMRVTCVLLVLFFSCAAASAQTINDLFDGTVLQEIRLDVNPKDWEAIKANPGSNTYYAANLRWRNREVDNVGIRQRGASTRNGIKPGLHVDFNRFQPGQTFLGLKSLSLDNNAQDASMMKERTVMAVFAKLGLPAAREVSTKLYVNDEYYGVYTLIEPVDKDFLKRVFGEDGGYLYEYQEPVNYHFEYLGSDPALYSPRFFEPKTHESNPDPAPIVAMIRTMNTASDTDFASAMAPYINLSLFMKHLAAEDFMAESDGILTGMNNFYLYRFQNGISQFLPKDKDLSFGGPPLNPDRPQRPLLLNAAKNVLIRRSLTVPEARDSYFKTITSLTQLTGAGGWMESEIMRIYSQIRAAVLADPVKQCFDGTARSTCTNDNFENEVAADVQFARQRGQSALAQTAQLSGQQLYAFNDRGGISLTKSNTSRSLSSGYGLIDPDVGSPRPDGVAIFTYRQNGIAVTETSVLASPAMQHGTIYVEMTNSGIKTGIAIANAGINTATVSFSFTDADARVFGQGNIVVPAGGQIARFLDEAPFNSAAGRATLNFDSSEPVFVAALRGLTNERFEFILSTLPVIDSAVSQGTVVIPHFADGGGWTTQIILTNPSSLTMRGSLQFIDQSKQAGTNTVSYSIAPRSYYRFQTLGTASSTQSGSVRIVPANNGDVPAAFGIFSFRKNGVTVSEAALQATPGATAYRLYAENSAMVQTGIAIANPSSDPLTVNLEATTLAGASAELSGTLTIPGNGQIATFLWQIPGFEKIGTSFQGVLRVSTTSASGIVAGGLRGRSNERGDFLVSTIPSVDETASTPRTQLAFPHYVEGGGYTTQFVLFSGRLNTAPSGVIRLFDQSGKSVSMQ